MKISTSHVFIGSFDLLACTAMDDHFAGIICHREGWGSVCHFPESGERGHLFSDHFIPEGNSNCQAIVVY